MPFFALQQKFLEIANRLPSKTALQIKDPGPGYRKYTYAEALALSRKIGFYLIRHGINKGERIGLILENGPLWPVFYFGILFASATAVPIDPQLTPEEIKNIVADSGAAITVDKAKVDEILKSLQDPPRDFNFPQTAIEEPASLLYTSGTTAVPKGVILTHKNFSANFESLNRFRIVSELDTVISVLPLHHSYAFMVTMLMPLCLGATITYVKTLKPGEILSAMKETGVTVMVGVPQLYYLFHKGILEKIKGIPRPIRFLLKPAMSKKVRASFGGRLRFFVSGGARLDPKVAKDLAGFGFTILEGYGLTETSPVVTFNPVNRQKFGSVGTVVPDVEIKISNPDSAGIGEVLIRGPNIMKGYYKRPAETSEAIKDGWFYSGDLGYIDKNRYLFLTGRSKEVVVLSSGKNIYPEEIEAHYKRSPFIKELCVMGVAKAGAGQELGAVIVPDTEYFKKTGEVNIREKIKWDLENLSKAASPHKRIMDFIIVKEELPKTRLGKIKRYEVERLYNKQFEDVGRRTWDEGRRMKDEGGDEKDVGLLDSEVGRKIIKLIKENRGVRGAIRVDDHLELDLGIDSLGRVELLVGLEKALGIKIPDADMAQVFTVRELVSWISKVVSGEVRVEAGAVSGADETAWKDILKQDPALRIREKIDLSPGFLSRAASFLGVWFLQAVFRFIFRLRVEGRENIPLKGPFVLCPNHSSYLDAFIVAASVPFDCEIDLFFLGFREYFIQPVIKNLVRVMRVIPVDPVLELVNAMQASSFVLRRGKSMCIFPEGQRSIDGKVKTFKKGIGILAGELDIPLVPVHIKGAHKAWPRSERFPRPAPIKIVFGEPFSVEYLTKHGREKGAAGGYEAIALGLREEVLKLDV